MLHQAYADASMLSAVRQHPAAASDDELRRLLQHILEAHRFWTRLCRGLPRAVELDSSVPAPLSEVIEQFRSTHAEEIDWVNRLQQTDLDQTVESDYFPGRRITVAEALTQVCLHSQGHRAQCASRLRLLGGEPPSTDYIHWVENRPTALVFDDGFDAPPDA